MAVANTGPAAGLLPVGSAVRGLAVAMLLCFDFWSLGSREASGAGGVPVPRASAVSCEPDAFALGGVGTGDVAGRTSL